MKKITIFIFALLVVTGVNVFSQEPSPAPPVPGKAEENKPTIKDKDAKNEYTPSQNPSPAIHDIKTVPANQKEKNQAKNTGDEATIKWTDWLLAAFTGVLSIFTGLLWWSTDKMWKATKDTADAAKRNSELAREEFIATHRPKLRVHSVFWGSDDNTGPYIQCSVDNIGESAAIVKEVSMELKILGDILPIPVPLVYGTKRLVEKTIHSGCSHTERFIPNSEIRIPPPADRNSLYFFGYIDYWDSMGSRRRVAFCRRYMPDAERFTIVQDENCEYSY
jgi:hypothetical protein